MRAPNVQERMACFLIALQYKYTIGYQIKKYVRFCCKSYNYYTRKEEFKNNQGLNDKNTRDNILKFN